MSKTTVFILDFIGLLGVISLGYGLYLFDIKIALGVMGILFICFSIFKQIEK